MAYGGDPFAYGRMAVEQLGADTRLKQMMGQKYLASAIEAQTADRDMLTQYVNTILSNAKPLAEVFGGVNAMGMLKGDPRTQGGAIQQFDPLYAAQADMRRGAAEEAATAKDAGAATNDFRRAGWKISDPAQVPQGNLEGQHVLTPDEIKANADITAASIKASDEGALSDYVMRYPDGTEIPIPMKRLSDYLIAGNTTGGTLAKRNNPQAAGDTSKIDAIVQQHAPGGSWKREADGIVVYDKSGKRIGKIRE